MVDYAFNPATDTITHGQSITWTWGGASSHNVTFESLPDSSGTQRTGNYQVTFANPGAYRYRCTLHSADFGSGMHGVIVVQ